MTDLRLLVRAVIFGMLLAITVGQFAFPGLGGLGGRPNLGGAPFLVQRGGGGLGGLGRFGGGGGGLGGLGRFGGGGGGLGGGFNPFQPTTTPPPTTTPQDPKKLANMLVEVISKNYEYHLTHDKNPDGTGNSTALPPKKLTRVESIKQAVWRHNLMQ